MDRVLKPVAKEQKLQREAKVKIMMVVYIQGPLLVKNTKTEK